MPRASCALALLLVCAAPLAYSSNLPMHDFD